MKKIITLSILVTSFMALKSQSNQGLWKPISEKEISVTGKRDIIPEKYKTFHLEVNSVKTILSSAPLDKNVTADNSSILISLPMPDGTIQNFKVVESPVMEEPLQMNFPKIRTYSIRGIEDQYANGKLDLTEFGFHGMIKSPNGDVYIDPYCKWNVNDYITYYTTDFNKPLNERGICEGVLGNGDLNKTAAPNAICAGANLKTYRLAVACTGEYARAACGTGTNTPTTSQILAKVVTSVNRVDGVYETEVAVKLVLVPTTTLVLFGVPGQGFTTAENNNASTLISKSQSIITSSVGTANFDIGHTFSTGGGGLASLGCVCSSGSKASGITGSPSPVGDPYNIDYVAHEMGHQFGGNHTFNGSTGSCSGNGNTAKSVEPGSGVTIMAYAGICTGQDLATNSIAYFHGVSYDEITNFINTGGGNNCDVMTTTGNNPPSVSAGSSYIVPKGTPFQLTGSATDPNGDALTYQWEETDPGAGFASWNSGKKPFFRSYLPTTSPTRLFPKLSVVLAGTYTTTPGEFLPGAAGTTFTTNTTLNFRLTARDNKMGGGGVCSAAAQVTVIASAGPFAVTSQSATGITYPSGSTQTVNWNVNNTNVAPVNCANVNIYISTDNGVTYTLSLANTPNDGTENIVLPVLVATKTTCRVKVESVGNVFFDINKKTFTITAGVTGLNQYSGSNPINIQLYPNPFSGSVKVDISATNVLDENKTVINVYDILGNIVKSDNIKLTENFSKVYDFSSLASGSYIVIVTDGKQKSVVRLIKL
ncbi:MAG: T9SS type A sorting domain-containing protein [Burkholderiales bacterium]|nr:T9SS type A sorting domain-containing protein [Bacteroidia bacterium]